MPDIPITAIKRGRPLDEILLVAQQSFAEAKRIAEKQGAPLEDAVSGALMSMAYRLYLLGVEDGMKGET